MHMHDHRTVYIARVRSFVHRICVCASVHVCVCVCVPLCMCVCVRSSLNNVIVRSLMQYM